MGVPLLEWWIVACHCLVVPRVMVGLVLPVFVCDRWVVGSGLRRWCQQFQCLCWRVRIDSFGWIVAFYYFCPWKLSLRVNLFLLWTPY
jgi:hypothetical protein